MNAPKLLIAKKEAADLLGVSVRSIENLVNEGSLPVIRLGKKSVRFRPGDLERFVSDLAPRANSGPARHPEVMDTD